MGNLLMFNVLCVTSGNDCAQLGILDGQTNKVNYARTPSPAVGSDERYNKLKTFAEKLLLADLDILKEAKVQGVMVDCWWGIVEAEGPGQYNWDGYKNLFSIVQAANLELHVSLPPKAVFQAWGARMNCVIFGGFEVLHV
jgi:hypothetical protein